MVYKLLKAFPSFVKPSYETAVHKKGYEEYQIGVAIPYGKRCCLWYTHYEKKDVCCIVEYNRSKQLQDNIHFLDIDFPKEFALGTILTGYLLDDEEVYGKNKYFIADDIFMLKGYEFGNPFPLPFDQKMKAFTDFFKELTINTCFPYSIHSIVLWNIVSEHKLSIPSEYIDHIGYNIKFIQMRCTNKILPHVNHTYKDITNINCDELQDVVTPTSIWSKMTTPLPFWNLNLQSYIYKKPCIFWIKPDIAYDVYFLEAKTHVLYQCALIPDQQTSKMMNSIFRKIPENDSLDKIEESDDEEDFENISENKYLKTQQPLLMECRFHYKFRKWIPVRSVDYTFEKYIPNITDLVFSDSRPSQKHNPNRNPNQRKPFQNRNFHSNKFPKNKFHQNR